MPLAQGKDGKSFLNFGKNVFGVLIKGIFSGKIAGERCMPR